MSNIRKIIPLTIKDDDLVLLIRNVFGLKENPYQDMDSDIILLAFIPKCKRSENITYRLNKKYGTCDHQTLEFFGDRILYGVIANIIYDFFGLSMTPHFYTTLNSILTKNRLLTDIMIDKSACELVRYYPYVIKEEARFHNICADSFEALIGAIFIHLKTKRLDYMTQIKNWLLKNTGLPYVFKQYLNDIGFKDKTIYVVNDREELKKKWIDGYQIHQSQLISKRNSMDSGVYDYLMDAYTKAQKVTINDFSFSGIIVDEYTPLYKLFEYLQWKYDEPKLKDSFYIVEGIPGGITTVIGSGNSVLEAIENAKKYLFARGYVVPARNISLQYSSQISSSQSSQSCRPSQYSPSIALSSGKKSPLPVKFSESTNNRSINYKQPASPSFNQQSTQASSQATKVFRPKTKNQ